MERIYTRTNETEPTIRPVQPAPAAAAIDDIRAAEKALAAAQANFAALQSSTNEAALIAAIADHSAARHAVTDDIERYAVLPVHEHNGRLKRGDRAVASFAMFNPALKFAENYGECGGIVCDRDTGRWHFGHGWHGTDERALACCSVLTA